MKIRRMAMIASTVIAIASPALISPPQTGADLVASTQNPISCDSLQAHLSTDKNYYIFKVSASGDNSAIQGYRIDFGDSQSYTVSFGQEPAQDHHAISVTHAYPNGGTYRVTAYVTVSSAKNHAVSSDACKATIAIGEQQSELPNTGVAYTLSASLAAIGALIGAGVHQLWLRRRHQVGTIEPDNV